MGAFDPDVFDEPALEQLSAFIDDHRVLLAGYLDGLTEAEARARLVPSKTTLLGLVKHATFVEHVWFDEAVTGRSRAEIGIPDEVDASFELAEDDTIASVLGAYAAAVAGSRARVAGLGLDDIVTGNRRGPCGLCCFTCCGNSPSIAATPTSSASNCWQSERIRKV